MNHFYKTALAAVLVWSILSASGNALGAGAVEAAALDAKEISRRFDKLYRAGSSRAVVTMEVVTPNYERTLKMTIWSRGMEDTLVRITHPPKERNTATLKKDNEMWNYLPRIKKTIRIPPSMMMSSWMGSDLTNDDLMRETSWEEDYEVALMADPPEGFAGLVYTPREGAPVTWSKVVGVFELGSYLPQKVEYFDEKGRLVRRVEFDQVGELGGRTLPRRVRVLPLSEDKKGSSTVMTYEEVEFDVELPADFFSLTRLRQGR